MLSSSCNGVITFSLRRFTVVFAQGSSSLGPSTKMLRTMLCAVGSQVLSCAWPQVPKHYSHTRGSDVSGMRGDLFLRAHGDHGGCGATLASVLVPTCFRRRPHINVTCPIVEHEMIDASPAVAYSASSQSADNKRKNDAAVFTAKSQASWSLR